MQLPPAVVRFVATVCIAIWPLSEADAKKCRSPKKLCKATGQCTYPDKCKRRVVKKKSRCSPGMVRIKGVKACCWPDQGWTGKKCVGTAKCPKGFVAAGKDCKAVHKARCSAGKMFLRPFKRCCWPDQGWNGKKCVGKPACPKGLVPVAGDECSAQKRQPPKAATRKDAFRQLVATSKLLSFTAKGMKHGFAVRESSSFCSFDIVVVNLTSTRTTKVKGRVSMSSVSKFERPQTSGVHRVDIYMRTPILTVKTRFLKDRKVTKITETRLRIAGIATPTKTMAVRLLANLRDLKRLCPAAAPSATKKPNRNAAESSRLLKLGQSAYKRGNYSLAVKYFSKSAKLDSHNLLARKYLHQAKRKLSGGSSPE